MTDWYTPSGAPSEGSDGDSSVIRAEFTSIKTNITDKLPTYTGNGNQIVAVNAGGTALTTLTAAALLTLLSSSAATFAGVTSTIDDAVTNDVTNVITATHTTTGTPANGIGTGIAFVTETAAGNNETGAEIHAVTTDVGSTTEDFDFVFNLMAGGAAAAEAARISSAGVFTAQSEIVVDNLSLNGNTLSSTSGNLVLTPASGTITSSSDFNITGSLTVDNIVANANDVYASSSDLTLNSGGSNSVRLYDGGLLATETTVDGLSVYDPDGDNPYVEFFQDGGSRNAFIQAHSTTGLIIENEVHGAPIILRSEDAGGTLRTLVQGDPDGPLLGYYAGSQSFVTTSTGMDVFAASGDEVLFRFLQDDGSTVNALAYAHNTLGFELRNLVHGANLTLSSEDAGGTVRNLFVGDPDGSVTLYWDGQDIFRTLNGEISVSASSGNANPFISFYDSTETTRLAYVQGHSTLGVQIAGEVHGAPITIVAEDSGGTARNLFVGDPDGSATLYYAGAQAAETGSTGFAIFDTSGDDPFLQFYQDDLSTRNGYLSFNSASGLIIENEVHDTPITFIAEDSGGTDRTLLVLDPGGDIALTPNSGNVTVPNSNGDQTQACWINGEVTGTASRDFNESDINNTVYSTSASDTYTVVTGLGYDGCVIQFITDGNSSTIGQGASLTLTWKQGGSSSTGARTIAAHSVVTLYRTSSTSWFIWGNGIS